MNVGAGCCARWLPPPFLQKVAMKEAKRQEAIGARAAREAKLAQKAANEMRATVVQTISKTHKLKVRPPPPPLLLASP